MCSYGTLPQIIQPTRVTPNTATIIDNIFTNNITDDIICGNILLTFSEHHSQFVSVNRGKIDYKKINIYERRLNLETKSLKGKKDNQKMKIFKSYLSNLEIE